MLIKTIENLVDKVIELFPSKPVSTAKLDLIKIVAHRGWHNSLLKENTIAAFDKCLEEDLFAIEFDVRWTKDLVPIVHHDESTFRVFGKHIDINSTLFKDLRKNCPDIPTLEEVVSKFGKHIHMFIELKDKVYPELEKQKIVLENILKPLEAKTDFHFLSLDESQFKAFDNFNNDCKVFVSQINANELSACALSSNYAGMSGHYILLNNKIVSSHVQRGQKVGTGFLKGKTALTRELNRDIEWIFTDHPWRLLDIIKSLRD